MVDEVGIYNLALSSVGTRARVSLPTEESREAEVCNLWFGVVRDQVLRAAHWPSARGVARLSVLAERDQTAQWVASDPTPGFIYAYALPSDFLYPRWSTTFGRFILGVYNNTTNALMSNEEEIVLEYTKRQTNIALWDPDLIMAVTHALAAYIAMPLHGKAARAREAADRANELIMNARVAQANANNQTYEVLPEWLSARGYAGGPSTGRFVYPYGNLINVVELAASA